MFGQMGKMGLLGRKWVVADKDGQRRVGIELKMPHYLGLIKNTNIFRLEIWITIGVDL